MRAARRSRPGDLPTNIRGSDPIRTALAGTRCCLIERTSPSPLTTRFGRSFRRDGRLTPNPALIPCIERPAAFESSPAGRACIYNEFGPFTARRSRLAAIDRKRLDRWIRLVQTVPTRPPETSQRKRLIIVLTVSVFLLFAILVSQTAFNQTILRPDTNQQAIVFYALSLLISLLFVALTFVLARNLLKLFAERRLGVLGSKFRTRMVVGALLLSFVPVMVMYWFAYGLMNRSIDKWFSTPVEEVRADTDAMASLLASYVAQNARSEAASIAASPETQH